MALPLKKRAHGGSNSVAKRLKRVETMARNNRPEMQTKTFQLSGTLAVGAVSNVILTAIAQGNDINDRKGNEIRVWRVEIRGVSDTGMDNYLLQLHTTSEPTAASFGPTTGAFLLDNESNVRYTEWKHYRNYNGTGGGDPLRIVQKFNGMRSHFNGATTTSGIRNQICFTALNRTATTQDIAVSCRIWYTDA